MDLLALAKTIADRIETAASRAAVPVAVCVIDIHGNVVLHHRMSGAPAFAIGLSRAKSLHIGAGWDANRRPGADGATWTGALPADVTGPILRHGRWGAARPRGPRDRWRRCQRRHGGAGRQHRRGGASRNLVVSGLLNKYVGGEIAISEITIKAHRGRVMRKMQAGSLADLVKMAARLQVGR